jgi:hypothetical protein
MLVLDEREAGLVATSARPWDWFITGLRAARLDRDLATGACPDAIAARALRAQRLVRMSVRRDLASSAQRILAAATAPAAADRLPVPVCLDRVRDAADEFQVLIRRLTTPGPVPAQGVARVSVLLGDAQGPLYHRASRQDLGALVREAADALNPLTGW